MNGNYGINGMNGMNRMRGMMDMSNFNCLRFKRLTSRPTDMTVM